MTISPEQEGRLSQHYLASIPEVERENVREAYEKGQRKAESLKESVPEKLKALWDDLLSMIAMLGDFIAGKYRDVPWKTIAAITAAILYFASPIDLIPDFIPLIGYLDDAFVIALAVDLIRDDLNAYRGWKNSLGATV